MNKIKLVVFDLYGTVIVDDNVVENSLVAAFSRNGISASPAEVRKYMGYSKAALIRDLFEKKFDPDIMHVDPDDIAPIMQATYEEYMYNVLAHWKKYPPEAVENANEVFLWLRERGVKVAFTTGFEKELALPLLAHLGWDMHQMPFVASNMVARGRPAPDMILSAMNNPKIRVQNPDEVVAVGDTVRDLQAADAAKVSINVLIDSALRIDQLCFPQTDPVVHFAIKSVRDLPGLLVSLERV